MNRYLLAEDLFYLRCPQRLDRFDTDDQAIVATWQWPLDLPFEEWLPNRRDDLEDEEEDEDEDEDDDYEKTLPSKRDNVVLAAASNFRTPMPMRRQ